VKPGPPPKPRALRVLEGNPAKRPLPPDIKPDVGISMPKHLTGAAKAEWARVVPQLRRLGLVGGLDRAVVSMYCVAWGRWLVAEGQLKRFGEVIKSPTGYPMQSPYLAIANTAINQMRALGAELGLSPASRTRVQADETLATFAQPNRQGSEGAASPERFFHHD
jgi:P27 family predicted phage terminase small subunit